MSRETGGPSQHEVKSGLVAETEKSREEQVAEQFREQFKNSTFIDGYVAIQTMAENKAVTDIDKRISIAAKKLQKPTIDQMALKLLREKDEYKNIQTIEEGQATKKAWGQAIGMANGKLRKEGVAVVIEGIESTLAFDDWQTKLQAEASEDFKEEKEAALAVLENAKKEYRGTLNDIGRDFDQKLAEPGFQDVLKRWGDAPALDKTIKHSGLVHFIEYRSDTSKNRLSKVPEAFSADGFVEYTNRIMSFVDNPKQEEVDETLYLRDESGRERLLIMTKDLQYISAFKYPADPDWKIITHVPDMNKKQWKKTKNNMREASSQAKYYNKLEGEIMEVEL